MRLAVIPARGGSKRIPRKNIKLFHGKPMIAYSIAAAIESSCFDKVIVSTDDQDIVDIAKLYGAEAPFLRPSNIADDNATTMDVMRHVVAWFNERNINFNSVCCIYATAPFILPSDIVKGMNTLEEEKIDFAFSATTFPFPIQRSFEITGTGGVEMLYPQYTNTRSQDLPETYHDAGQFYWGRPSSFVEAKGIFSQNSRAIVLPRKRVQDIDTPEDWDFAETLYSVLQNG